MGAERLQNDGSRIISFSREMSPEASNVRCRMSNTNSLIPKGPPWKIISDTLLGGSKIFLKGPCSYLRV